MGTKFTSVYDRFLGKITDDMYMELTYQDTLRDMQSLLVDSVPGFEFPRKNLDYTLSSLTVSGDTVIDNSSFGSDLDSEEINILAILMMNAWLQRQVTSIENTRMKYSGTDFKFTSQANHLSKLLVLLAETQRQSIHMQRLYKRRRTENGLIRSNWDIFRHISAISDDESGSGSGGSSGDTSTPVNVQRLFVADGDELVLDDN